MKKLILLFAAFALTGCFRSTGGTEVGIKFNKLTGGDEEEAEVFRAG